MKRVLTLLLFMSLLAACDAYAWTVTTKWIPGQFNGWYTWDAAGHVDESIILSPAQPDGNTYTNRIVTPAGINPEDGVQIAGMSYDFSDEKEVWRQFYIYYPLDYTFHPIAEKIAGWHYTTNQTNNMQLVWFYDTFDWGTGNGWWDPPLGLPDYPENVPAKQKGHWYTFYEHIKMNDVGQNNGIYQLWVDDKLVYDRSNIGYLHPTDSAANGFNHARQYLVWGGQATGYPDLSADMYSYYGTSTVSTDGATTVTSPYAQSDVILSVSWDHDNLITGAPGYAEGSDLWPSTWGNDGEVWTAWGDGGGFWGTNLLCRTSTGVARITGSPPSSLSYQNILGCAGTGQGCVPPYELNASCNTLYATPYSDGWTPDSILDIGGTLYLMATDWDNPNYPVGWQTIRVSTNGGATWSTPSWNWDFSTEWYAGGFVQYGQGYFGGDSNYVYVTGEIVSNTTSVYLARVPRGSITTKSAYEWYTSTDPNTPTWGTLANAQPIYVDPSRQGLYWGPYGGSDMLITYFPQLNRYIMTGPREYLDEMTMFESQNPWGPWKTVAWDLNWGGYPQESPLTHVIVPKWISGDGRTFWMAFSSSGVWDRFNLIQGTFTLASGGDTTPPEISLMSPGVGATDWTVTNRAVSFTVSDPSYVDSSTLLVDIIPTGTNFSCASGLACTPSGDPATLNVVYTKPSDWEYSTTYTVNISSVYDLADIPNKQSTSWQFTTEAEPPDTAAPTLVSSTPSSGQAGWALNNWVVVFDITDAGDVDSSTLQFNIDGGATQSCGAGLSCTFTTPNTLLRASYNRGSDWACGTTYTANIPQVKDATGNTLNTSWTFSTVACPEVGPGGDFIIHIHED